MTTQAELDAYVAAMRGVRRLVLRDLSAWWATLPSHDPVYVQRAAAEFMPALVGAYGEGAAAIGADFYETARASSIGGTYRATAATPSAGRALRVNTRWALGPLWGPNSDPQAALARLSKVADQMALQPARDSIVLNTRRDPRSPRYARVPQGKTCAWCLVLASRGAVYRSAETAGADNPDHYHARCDCEPVPSWKGGKDLPEGYDEGELYGLYDRARREAGDSGDIRDITAAMRRLDGGSLVNDGVALRP